MNLPASERDRVRLAHVAQCLWEQEQTFGVGAVHQRLYILRAVFDRERARGVTIDALASIVRDVKLFVIMEYVVLHARRGIRSLDNEATELRANALAAVSAIIDAHVRAHVGSDEAYIPDGWKAAIDLITSADPAKRDHLIAPMTPRERNLRGKPFPRILKAARARLADAGIAIENRDLLLEAIGVLPIRKSNQ
jgi:hypothetical protein